MMDQDQLLEKLRLQLCAIHPLEGEAWEDFSAIWVPVKYKRKALITVAGETEKYLYWVTEGVQRGFHVHGNKEATIVFTYPYSFSGIIDSFLTRQPSRYFLETLTTSSFLKTSHTQFELVRKKWPSVAELIYQVLAVTVGGVLERQVELMVYTAEEKFRILLKRSPHILNLVPHKYLASYLGLDPTTFSKLLATVKIG